MLPPPNYPTAIQFQVVPPRRYAVCDHAYGPNLIALPTRPLRSTVNEPLVPDLEYNGLYWSSPSSYALVLPVAPIAPDEYTEEYPAVELGSDMLICATIISVP